MKRQVSTNNSPSAKHILSQAVVSGDYIFVSGQIHALPDNSLVEGSTQDKVEQVMKNIKNILKAADSNLDDIVKVVIYVTDMSIMPALNEVYPSYFSQPYPAREALCVKELPLGATIEISVVAVD